MCLCTKCWNAKDMSGFDIRGTNAPGNISGTRCYQPRFCAVRPACTEFNDAAPLCCRHEPRRFTGNQGLEIYRRQHVSLYQLRLDDWRSDAQHRFHAKDCVTFLHSIDIPCESQLSKVIKKIAAHIIECRMSAKIINLFTGES